MKPHVLILLLISCLLSCKSKPSALDDDPDKISYQAEDRAILEQIFELYAGGNDESTSALMVKVGSFFKGTPYVAHTLEQGTEQLIINLREMDCTTFAENCLAISRAIKSGKPSFEEFTTQLQSIRYRDGVIDGYASRLHYFCDWIYNNQEKRMIKDMSEDFAQTPFPKEINFMSTHPDSYSQLKDSTSLVGIIATQEKEITAREMFFIPEGLIAEIENELMDGDIAGITTSIDGLAIQHVVILIRKEGRIHLLHASSKAEEVEISDLTLEEYLLSSNSATGIMLARPL